jgi:hypothetical protein
VVRGFFFSLFGSGHVWRCTVICAQMWLLALRVFCIAVVTGLVMVIRVLLFYS